LSFPTVYSIYPREDEKTQKIIIAIKCIIDEA
jgi:hypothetical protein